MTYPLNSYCRNCGHDSSHLIIAKCIITERINARHWIADSGPGIGSCMYVCMSVTLWNIINKALHMRNGKSIIIFVFVYMCVSVWLRLLQLTSLHTWIIINMSKEWWCDIAKYLNLSNFLGPSCLYQSRFYSFLLIQLIDMQHSLIINN